MTVFPEGPERNRALGIWGGIGGIGATAGLVIGGPVTAALGWEGVFFINIPVAIVVLALSRRLLPESRDTRCARCFDLGGAVTVTVALVLLTYAIAHAPEVGWTSSQTIALLGCVSISLALVVLIEARSQAPLVPLRILRSRPLVDGNLVLLTAGMSVDGMLLIATIYAQDVLGYSTLQFGLMTAVMTVMSVVGAYSAQAVVARTGFRRVGVTGMALVGAGWPAAHESLCRRQLQRGPLGRTVGIRCRARSRLRRLADRRPRRRARAGVRPSCGARRQLVQHRRRARCRHPHHRRRLGDRRQRRARP
jgi:hypothetical protein